MLGPFSTPVDTLGGKVARIELTRSSAESTCDQIADSGATAALLLTGIPDPAIDLVTAIRRDRRLSGVTIATPAGQAEFASWMDALGAEGLNVPFLSYTPPQLTELGVRVTENLTRQMRRPVSFVALEGYDTILAIAEWLRLQASSPERSTPDWLDVTVSGTRGQISFSRMAGVTPWQWQSVPIRIVQYEALDAGEWRTPNRVSLRDVTPTIGPVRSFERIVEACR